MCHLSIILFSTLIFLITILFDDRKFMVAASSDCDVTGVHVELMWIYEEWHGDNNLVNVRKALKEVIDALKDKYEFKIGLAAYGDEKCFRLKSPLTANLDVDKKTELPFDYLPPVGVTALHAMMYSLQDYSGVGWSSGDTASDGFPIVKLLVLYPCKTAIPGAYFVPQNDGRFYCDLMTQVKVVDLGNMLETSKIIPIIIVQPHHPYEYEQTLQTYTRIIADWGFGMSQGESLDDVASIERYILEASKKVKCSTSSSSTTPTATSTTTTTGTGTTATGTTATGTGTTSTSTSSKSGAISTVTSTSTKTTMTEATKKPVPVIVAAASAVAVLAALVAAGILAKRASASPDDIQGHFEGEDHAKESGEKELMVALMEDEFA